MSKYTKEDIIRICEEEKVSFINLQFTDIMIIRTRSCKSYRLIKPLAARENIEASRGKRFTALYDMVERVNVIDVARAEI